MKEITCILIALLIGSVAMAQQTDSQTLELRPGMISDDFRIPCGDEIPKVLAMQNENMTINIEVENMETMEIVLNFKDKSFRFQAEELRNLLEGRQYDMKVTVKK